MLGSPPSLCHRLWLIILNRLNLIQKSEITELYTYHVLNIFFFVIKIACSKNISTYVQIVRHEVFCNTDLHNFCQNSLTDPWITTIGQWLQIENICVTKKNYVGQYEFMSKFWWDKQFRRRKKRYLTCRTHYMCKKHYFAFPKFSNNQILRKSRHSQCTWESESWMKSEWKENALKFWFLAYAITKCLDTILSLFKNEQSWSFIFSSPAEGGYRAPIKDMNQ